MSRLIVQWVMQQGAAWSVALFAALAALSLIWPQRISESLGRLLVSLVILTFGFLNVWLWAEPGNYVGMRTTQLRYETYIRSIDEYYAPFEAILDRKLVELGAG